MKSMRGRLRTKEGKPVPGFLLVLNSDNVKTGNMPMSTSPEFTCPLACPYKEHGCYAAYGPIKMWWKSCTESCANVEEEYLKFLGCVKKEIPRKAIWRHNQAGDLVPSKDSKNLIDVDAAFKLVMVNQGKRGYTYTHYPVVSQKGIPKKNVSINRQIVEEMNKSNFTVNISCNSLAHVDEVIDSQLKAPVTVTLPENFKDKKVSLTPKGHKVILCPAIWKEGMTCIKCQACMNPKRKAVIGFAAHGTGRKYCEQIAKEWEKGAPKSDTHD